MGFSCGDDLDEKESVIRVVDETSRGEETRNRVIGMEVSIPVRQIGIESPSNNNDFFFFCPIEHPIEPAGDEDQPVKCPIPHSSLINDDRFSDGARKRTELSTGINKDGVAAAAAAAKEAPPAQAVRKRHHKTTHGGDHTLTSLLRMPPLNPPPTHPNASAVQQI